MSQEPGNANRDAVLDHNARAWDRLAGTREPLARPAVDEAFGDPRTWLGGGGTSRRPWIPERLDGLSVLCLAAGGGKHGPLYAAAGARVTVVDLSAAMLDLDRQVARERGIDLEILQGSMDDLGMLEAGRFDLVVHPVSTCYVPDVGRVFREVARVVKPGGLYVSQHKAPASLQSSLEPGPGGRYELLHPAGARGLELAVRDFYTGQTRGVETLSGGEMFLASLALALGLSDVVQANSGGTRLDSLFVDEGFGTLDPEVLDLAMNTLTELQRSGRLVGLISHVAEMRERIPLRLEVVPGRRGSTTRVAGWPG